MYFPKDLIARNERVASKTHGRTSRNCEEERRRGNERTDEHSLNTSLVVAGGAEIWQRELVCRFVWCCPTACPPDYPYTHTHTHTIACHLATLFVGSRYESLFKIMISLFVTSRNRPCILHGLKGRLQKGKIIGENNASRQNVYPLSVRSLCVVKERLLRSGFVRV